MIMKSMKKVSRRTFVQGAAAAAGAPKLVAQTSGSVRGFDHVALPMQNTAAMMAFYRGLGFAVTENPRACSVYIGDQMINFHQPATWQDATFTLRAPAASLPAAICVSCGTARRRRSRRGSIARVPR